MMLFALAPCLVQKCFHDFLLFYIFQAVLLSSEIKNASAVNISGSKNQPVSEICTVREKGGDVIASKKPYSGIVAVRTCMVEILVRILQIFYLKQSEGTIIARHLEIFRLMKISPKTPWI